MLLPPWGEKKKEKLTLESKMEFSYYCYTEDWVKLMEAGKRINQQISSHCQAASLNQLGICYNSISFMVNNKWKQYLCLAF